MRMIWEFFKGTLILVAKGSRAYYLWVCALLIFILCFTPAPITLNSFIKR